jgi:hypothetical protein
MFHNLIFCMLLFDADIQTSPESESAMGYMLPTASTLDASSYIGELNMYFYVWRVNGAWVSTQPVNSAEAFI